jgi:N6-adenosine-specific RNA methylase IME4
MTGQLTLMLALRDITVLPDRMRQLRPNVVDELAASMAERGLLHPIVVRRQNIGNVLVAGWHRLEVAKKLKSDRIRAVILEGVDADQAQLAEIDENLIRADLTPAERALHLARRKQLYEKAHPETRPTKAGGPGRAKTHRQNGDDTAERFTQDAAKKIGRSERTVQREIARAGIPGLRDAVGTSLDQPEELDTLLKLPEPVQHDLIERAKSGERVTAKHIAKKINREAREQELGRKQLALPDKKYGVIVEDYEWDFEVFSRATGMDRHAANHYPVSEDAHTAQEIVERTKDRFACAAEDCALFMWTTVPHLAIAIEVLRLRGFRYVSNFVWDKIKVGTGYWSRNRHEHCLLGIKGNIPCPAPGEQFESLFSILATEHSAKPECFLEIIGQYFPHLPKIELNRRGPPRPGWNAWGLEVQQAAVAEFVGK